MTDHRPSRLLAGLVSLIASLIATPSAAADVIELRPSVSISPGEPLTLAALARLEGPEAQALGQIVIVADPAQAMGSAGWVEVSLEQVRAALQSQGNVNWGRVALSGQASLVRLAQTPAQLETRERAPLYEAREPRVVDLSGPATIRVRIARDLARFYSVAPEGLQLLFDDRDEEFLSTLEHGRRIEVQPAASASSGRMPVIVRMYQNLRIVDERTVRVDVRLRQQVVVLAADVRRGEALTPEHVREESVWLAPGPMLVSSVDAAVGGKMKARLAAGTPLRAHHIETPVVVRRNELVTVRCLSGGVVLTGKARALADGRLGDLIEMRLEGATRSFLARVDGPGRAVAQSGNEDRAEVESALGAADTEAQS